VQTEPHPISPVANPCCNRTILSGRQYFRALGQAMTRRSRGSDKRTKARRHKAEMPKRRAARTVRRRNSSTVVQETEVTHLRSERDEALLRETANAEILRLISKSPGDLELVFRTILEHATRICNANFGTLFRFDGERFYPVAEFNTPAALREAQTRRGPFQPEPGTAMEHVLRTKQVSHSADKAAEPVPGFFAEHGGARSQVAVPVLKGDLLVGVIVIYHQEVRPFTDKQIELLQNFAAQAAIAIENARLLNELRQRTTDLTESLEQQTATSDVLQIISSSPGDLEPVFQAMLTNATRVCDAAFGNLYLCEADAFRVVAAHHDSPAYIAARTRNPLLRPPPDAPLGRVAITKQVVQVADIRTLPSRDHPFVAPGVTAGYRTVLSIPLLKDDELIGALTMIRQQVRPFTDKQIALLTNFARQAVIAIENTRLLNDLNKLNQQLERRVAEQVSEIERMSRLRRFLPPQVADLIVASGAEKQLESHRREITALFCDLRGFTSFSEASAPEDVMALLRDYHAAIGEIIIKYSGTLERYAGDGVMVVFNDPVPVDNPALRAVLMALETREAMGALMEKWRQLGHDVGFGIGIAHGFATLGTIGFEGRFDYAAIGTVSNVASRLCDEAKPGQILISPRVFTAVKDAVTVEPMGEFTLKGIGRPLAAYNVLDAKPAN
jgi:class 3 adenylate cyclase